MNYSTIGGPDGPSVIFVSTSPDRWIWPVLLLAAGTALAVGVGLILHSRKK